MIDLPALLHECAVEVSPVTMRAVLRVESNFQPNAIGVQISRRDGSAFHLDRQPADRTQAIAWARWLLANGYRFDAGMAQINSGNFDRYGLTPESVFEPCQNLRTGARILSACYTQALPRYGHAQAALAAALSCYNSGNFQTGFGNGYVNKVLLASGGQSLPGAAPDAAGHEIPPLRALSGIAQRPLIGKMAAREAAKSTTAVASFGSPLD